MLLSKAQLFWEGHKNERNFLYGFEIYIVKVKTLRTIAQTFVAFSEKLNFNKFQPWKAGKKCLTPMITFQAPLFTKVEF